MKFIGFNFNKISAEKSSNSLGDLNINTNIDIKDIKEVKSELLKSKDEIINLEFIYNIEYAPKIAKIEFSGNVLISDNPKSIKEILNEWKKKKISDEFRINVFNLILRKANIKAMQFEDEMNLPLHLPLPVLKKQENN